MFLVLAAPATAKPTFGAVDDPVGDPVGEAGAVPDLVRVAALGDGRASVLLSVDFAGPLPLFETGNPSTALGLTLDNGQFARRFGRTACEGRTIELQLNGIAPTRGAGSETAFLQRDGTSSEIAVTKTPANGGRRLLLAVRDKALAGFTPTCSAGARVVSVGIPPTGFIPSCPYCLTARTSPAFLGSDDTDGFALNPLPPLTAAQARAAARAGVKRKLKRLRCTLRGANRARCTYRGRGGKRRAITVTRDALGRVRARLT